MFTNKQVVNIMENVPVYHLFKLIALSLFKLTANECSHHVHLYVCSMHMYTYLHFIISIIFHAFAAYCIAFHFVWFARICTICIRILFIYIRTCVVAATAHRPHHMLG